MEEKIKKLYINDSKGGSKYLPTNSQKQLLAVYECNQKELFKLLSKHLDRKTKLNNVFADFKENTEDLYIYTLLKKYKYPDRPQKEFSPSFNPRGDKRVQELDFLWKLDAKICLFSTFKDRKYLDFGGGDGSITAAIASKMNLNKEASVCVDIKEWEGGENKFNKNFNITYVPIGIGEKLPFKNDEFSIVSAFQVLHHIKDIDFALNELVRVMKNKGVLVLREHDADNDCSRMLIDIEHALFETTLSSSMDNGKKFLQTYEAYYRSKKNWEKILHEYGFKLISDTDISGPTRYYYAVYVLSK